MSSEKAEGFFLHHFAPWRCRGDNDRAPGDHRPDELAQPYGDWNGANAIPLRVLATAPLIAFRMILDMVRRGPAIIQRAHYVDPFW